MWIGTGERMRQDSLRGRLANAGVDAGRMVCRHADVWVHLADGAGFITPDGAELKRLEAEDAVQRVCSIGGYAVPVGFN